MRTLNRGPGTLYTKDMEQPSTTRVSPSAATTCGTSASGAPVPATSGRRNFLRNAIIGAGTLSAMRAAFAGRAVPIEQSAVPAPAAPPTGIVPGTIRLAHLTDIHVQPELRAEAGMASAFNHAQANKPDLIITGGDAVMDVFEAKRSRAEQLRGIFQGTLKRECSVPVHHVTGNHDILGWNRKKSESTGTEADWGKRFACDLFGISRNYYTFDHGPWRFICLDSVQPKDDRYTAYLDDAQMEWLTQTLAATPKSMPVAVVSHIPILSLTALTYGAPRSREHVGTDTVIFNGEMHTDATLLHDLFKQAGNVKVCLSGHVHLLDHCMIDGISYICDGAVCGSWWKGAVEGIPEGYGVLDLRPDGTFTHRYERYGWQAQV